MARIFIFTIFARLLLPLAHFSSKFTKLSFIWYFSTFMSILTKKFFLRCAILGESPGDEMIFSPKNRSCQKLHRFHFSTFFSKFQKEVLEDFRRHLSYYWGGVRNFDPFYFLGGELSKHAACFDISPPKKYKGSKFRTPQ